MESKEEHVHLLNFLYTRKESSLKDEIDKRRRNKNYFSYSELRNLIEYSFEQMVMMNIDKIYNLNIKPSNLLKNIRSDYSFSEFGYPSVNSCLDNDVFRSPQFLDFLKSKKPITSMSPFDKESADIFSLGMCFV